MFKAEEAAPTEATPETAPVEAAAEAPAEETEIFGPPMFEDRNPN